MTEKYPTTLFFIVFNGKHVALVKREGFDDWDIVRGVFKNTPTEEQVQMMLRTDLFDDITIEKMRVVAVEPGENSEIFPEHSLFECTVTGNAVAKDYRVLRFWSGIGMTSGLNLSDAAGAVISIESIRDRLF